jgi:two-component system chemotaxis response regulator CheY
MAFNILVVDDSKVMREMIVRTLRLSGLSLGEILEAANGQEALERLKESWVDLVLADVNMPVMDGETMVERMRADPALRAMPVLFVSTESSQKRIKLLLEKSSGFVHKPFNPEEIRELILSITGAGDETRSEGGVVQGGAADF